MGRGLFHRVNDFVTHGLALVAALSIALQPAFVYALPQGGVVVGGDAQIAQGANQMTITQGSERAIIDWQGFDIGSGEGVQFVQPGASAIALNRIYSGSPSQILGNLSANGNVWLVNPHGVVFGSGAVVNVGGLLASTANISNEDFLSGNHRFTEAGMAGAMIINEGQITVSDAGMLAFVAPQVRNSGFIMAKLGRVSLGAAETFTLDLYGDELISLEASGAIAQHLLEHSGSIDAQGGVVVLTAAAGREIVDSLINVSGEINVDEYQGSKGRILIKADEGITTVAGNLNAQGSEGGDIDILGERVAILSGANINASGENGGGFIRIGGDYQGQGVTPTASRVIVQSGSNIYANAIANGDGGRVIVWADDRTDFAGYIEAKGGALGGNGGFVETSGKNILVATGLVDASSPWGVGGMWLLDPNNITINATANANVSSSGVNPLVWDTTDDSAVVTVASILTSLNAGTSVTIQTGTAGANTQAGNITVASDIAKTAGGDATLTLKAANDIIVNTNVDITSSSNKLNVTFNADSDASGAGAILMNSGSTIVTNGGNIVMGGGADPTLAAAVGNATNIHGIYLDSATLNAGGGNISLRGTGYGGGAASAHGIFVDNNDDYSTNGIFTTGTGTITLTGTGGTGSNGNNNGVYVYANDFAALVEISAQNGAISITGTGGASTGDYNYGIALQNGADAASSIYSTGSGTITLTGTGGGSGAGSSDNYGVRISGDTYGGNAKVSGVSGAVSITGTGGTSTGGYNYGVYFYGLGLAETTGAGNLSITGTGGTNSGNENVGVYLSTSGLIRTTSTGNVTITGTGGGTGASSSNYGVRLVEGADIFSTAMGGGNITINATGGDTGGTGADNYGFSMEQASGSTTITTVDGDVTINGTGSNASGGSSIGIWMKSGTSITASGSGDVTMTGISNGTGDDWNEGFEMTDADILAATGNVTIVGTAGTGANGNHIGVDINGGSIIRTTSGTITVTGTGGTGGLNNYDFYTDATAGNRIGVSGTTTGNINLYMDSVAGINTLAVNTSGTATIAPRTAATTIGVAGATGTLALSTTILNKFDGVTGTLQIGRTDGSGLMRMRGWNAAAKSWNLSLQTGNGNIQFDGTVNMTMAANKNFSATTYGTGDIINAASSAGENITTSGTGTIILHAGDDLLLSQDFDLTTASGALTLRANDNIHISGGGSLTTTGGNVVINSDRDESGANGGGIYLENVGTIATSGGNVVMGGGADPTTTAARGTTVSVDNGVWLNNVVMNTGSGSITVRGQGNTNAGGGNVGVYISGGSTNITSSNSINFYGTGGAAGGTSNDGIGMYNGGTIAATGTGTINFTGVGVNGTTGNTSGIHIVGNSTISAVDGNITFNGTNSGNNGDDNYYGIDLSAGGGTLTVRTTGTGDINFTGTGGTGGAGSNIGINLNDADVTVANGDIVMNGTGGAATGSFNTGVYILNTSNVTASGVGTISLTGLGGGSGSATESTGLEIYSGSVVSTNSGTLTVTGTGGTGTGTSTHDGITGNRHSGIELANNGRIQSTSGNITVTGTGGTGDADSTNHGIILVDEASGNPGLIINGSGTLTINAIAGTGGATNYGLFTDTTANTLIGNGSTSGNITINADTLSIDSNTTINTTGNVTIAPYTASTTIGVAGATGTLAITDTILNNIAANTLTIGRSDGSGLLRFDGHNLSAENYNLALLTGNGNIQFDGTVATVMATNKFFTATTSGAADILTNAAGSITTSGTGLITLSSGRDINFAHDFDLTTASGALTLRANDDIIYSASGDLNTNGAAIVLNSDRDASSAGAISLATGTVLTSTGGNITLGGGADPTTGSAWGTADVTAAGIYLNGSTVNAGGGNIIMNATGYGTGSSRYGLYLVNSATAQTSGTGTITLSGTGGADSAATSNNHGIVLGNSSSVTSTGSGAISLTGIRGGGGSQYGIVTVNASNVVGGASASGNLTLTTDNVSFAGSTSFQTSGNIYVQAYSANTTVGIGGATGTLGLTDTYLGYFSAATLSIGRSDGSGLMRVEGADLSATNYHLALLTGSANIQFDGNGALTLATNKNLTATTYAGGDIVSGGAGSFVLSGTGAFTWVSDDDITNSHDLDITTASGAVTFQADDDIVFSGSGDVNTTAAAVTFNSDRDASGQGAIDLGTGTAITTSGGNITLGGGADPSATAARGTAANIEGIRLDGATLSAGAGNISLRGTGYASGTGEDYGILLINSASVGTTSGSITMVGTGGGVSGDWNQGVDLNGSIVSATGGAISITGTGGTGPGSYGVALEPSAVVSNTGSGTITVVGTGGTGNGIAGGNRGVDLHGTAQITAVNGAITVTGTGGSNSTAGENSGVHLYNGPSISSTGNGAITITGIAGTGGSNNYGIWTNTGSNTIGGVSAAGNITLNADTVAFAANTSIRTTGNVIVAPYSQNGTIGVGGATGTLNITDTYLGYFMANTLTIGRSDGTGLMRVQGDDLSARNYNLALLNGNGNIQLDGTEAFSMAANKFFSATTAGTGDIDTNAASSITASGTGYILFAAGDDVIVDTDFDLITASGDVTLRANDDIVYSASGDITTSGGAVVINSDRDASGQGAIDLGTGTAIATSGGNITLGGGADPTVTAARGTAAKDDGIRLNASTLSAGSGNILMRGQGYATGTDDVNGVEISGATVSTTSGNITIVGNGAGTGSWGYGVALYTGTVASTGGNIAITGTGSTSGANHAVAVGINLETNATVSNSGTGTITLTGTGGSGTGGDHRGISLYDTGAVTSTGSGAITLTGIGGTGGSNNHGIYISNGTNTIGGASASGDITINTDTINWANTSIRTTGNVFMQAYNAATTVGIGGATGTLNITDTDLGYFMANTLTIGRSDGTGLMRVQGDDLSARNYNLALLNGNGNIQLDGTEAFTMATNKFFSATTAGTGDIDTSAASSITASGTGYILFSAGDDLIVDTDFDLITASGDVTLRANDDIVYSASGDITTSGGAVVINSDRDATSGGATNIGSGTAIATSGGNITIGGGADPTATAAVGTAANVWGILLSGASLNAGAGNISMRGQGYTGGSGGNGYDGVTIFNSSSVTASGNISIIGAGGLGNTANYGVSAYGGTNTISATGSGNLTITGTGGTGAGGANYGLLFDDGATISVANGAMNLTGTGGASGGNNRFGIRVADADIQATGSGSITMAGTGGGTSGNTHVGVYLTASSAVSANGGAISITGNGGAVGTIADGLDILGSISNTGTGTITLAGTGGAQGGHGVQLYGASALVTGVNGAVNVTGTGGNAGANSHGVYMEGGGVITSTGSSAITVTGLTTNGANSGIYTLNGAANRIGTTGGVTTGNITLVADSIDLGTSFSANTTGDITVRPYTSGTSMGIGTGAGSLSISTTELGYLNWGSSGWLKLGSTTAGAMDINTNFAFTKPVEFRTANTYDITQSGTITSSAAGKSVVLASGDDYHNSVGAGAFSLSNGARWLIYSVLPTDNTQNSLVANNTKYNSTFAGYGPSSVVEAGNVYIYSGASGNILTFTIDNKNRAYGDANPAFTYVLSGLQGTDTAADAFTGAASITTAANATSAAGTYNITGAQGTITLIGAYVGYTLDFITGTLTVDPAALTVTANNASKTYGQTVNFAGTEFSATGLKNGETIGSATINSAGAAAAANAGSYAVAASAATGGTFTASNYTITYVDGTMTVGKATLTATVQDQTITYGANTPTLAATNAGHVVWTGLVNGDTSAALDSTTFSYGGATAGNVNNAGSYTLGISAFSDNNYTLSIPAGVTTGTLTINKAALTAVMQDQTITYGDTTPTQSATNASHVVWTGLVNGDTAAALDSTTFSYGGATAGGVNNAGTYTLGISAFSDNNYSLNVGAGVTTSTLTINKKAITADVQDLSLTYGDTTPTLSATNTAHVTWAGLVNGDTSAALDSTTFSYGGATAGGNNNAGSYTLSISAFSDNNYSLSIPAGVNDGTLTIGKKALTVTADTKTVTYGTAVPAGTVSYSGFVLGETSAVLDTAASANSVLAGVQNAGTYGNNFTASGAVDGNYSFTYVAGDLIVNKATLTATVQNQGGLTYGDLTPTLSATNASHVVWTGLVNGDTSAALDSTTFSYGGATAGASNNAGSYTLGISAFSDNNYTLNVGAGVTTGTMTIGKKSLSVTIDNASRTYGDANPTFTAQYAGFVNGETAAVLDTLPTYSSAAASANVGSYAITGAGGLDGNYNFAGGFVDGTLTIGKANLIVSANNLSVVEGHALPSFTASYSGLKLGQSFATSGITGAPLLSSLALQGSPIGSYAITAALGSLASGNYHFSAFVNGTLSITTAQAAAASTGLPMNVTREMELRPAVKSASPRSEGNASNVSFSEGVGGLGPWSCFLFDLECISEDVEW